MVLALDPELLVGRDGFRLEEEVVLEHSLVQGHVLREEAAVLEGLQAALSLVVGVPHSAQGPPRGVVAVHGGWPLFAEAEFVVPPRYAAVGLEALLLAVAERPLPDGRQKLRLLLFLLLGPVRREYLSLYVLAVGEGLLRVHGGLPGLGRRQHREASPADPVLVSGHVLVEDIPVHQVRRLRAVVDVFILLGLVVRVLLQEALVLVGLVDLVALPVRG